MQSNDDSRKLRKRTESSSFGVSKREGHDSSKYYNSKLYENVPKESDVGIANEFPSELKNQLLCRDSRDMSIIPSNSVHHMITSPPYNVSKEYDV